jgi:bifunctional isochorismate lyase/aryl carrier protein
MYLGLDSIRVMSLLENWRSRGAQITFLDLAEVTTLNQWWEIIAASMQHTAPVEALA